MPLKPTNVEEEYFARINAQLLKKIEDEKRLKLTAEEQEKLKALHYMRCPKCGRDLVEISFQDVMVDKCPHCEGLWLDKGELEKIIARGEGTGILEMLTSRIRRRKN